MNAEVSFSIFSFIWYIYDVLIVRHTFHHLHNIYRRVRRPRRTASNDYHHVIWYGQPLWITHSNDWYKPHRRGEHCSPAARPEPVQGTATHPVNHNVGAQCAPLRDNVYRPDSNGKPRQENGADSTWKNFFKKIWKKGWRNGDSVIY